jgi:hypothetical protein
MYPQHRWHLVLLVLALLLPPSLLLLVLLSLLPKGNVAKLP